MRVIRAAHLLALSAILAIATSGCGKEEPKPAAATPGWPAPSDPAAAADKAGLQVYGKEMLDIHYHVHLDVVIDGKPVIVPANLGIQANPRRISALHTHDSSGILHIESADNSTFTLGQAFTLWGQPLGPSRIGPVQIADPEVLRVFQNGAPVNGDPAQLVLTQHAEIMLWVGPASSAPDIISSFSFPPGT